MAEDVSARAYHRATEHSPSSAGGGRMNPANRPRPYKVYEGLPAVPLADSLRPSQCPTLRAVASDGSVEGGGRPDLDVLTQLCYYSNGITRTLRRGGSEMAFRAAACTGALYHVDLYLATADLAGLDAGVYHFDPRTLSLDVLREGDHRGALAEAAGGEPAVARAPVAVVATSTWWRNAWKYGERTYRHAFWDSGTVLANLLAVAHAHDLPARVVTGFADSRVADLVGVDVAREAPVALVPVGGGDDAPAAPAIDPIDPETRLLSPIERHYDRIEGAYRASSLPDGDAVRAWRADALESDGLGTRPPGDGERVALDPVDDARAVKTPLHWTVERRGSCREYERDTLGFRKVSTVLDRGTRGVPMDARAPDGPALRYVDCYLVVHDVEGVTPGVYHYHPDDGVLERLRAGEFRSAAGHAALDQRLAADAGLCACFLADLDAVTGRLGDRGYRVAQHEAALTAGRLWLAAYAHRDLGATGLTFYDGALVDLVGDRAAGQQPMFLWTLGRPADARGSSTQAD